MNVIIYTQRVDIVESYQERRDCADQNIPRFIAECGYVPIAIPNIPEFIPVLLDTLRPKGVVMTGGNSLMKYGGNAVEKDETDRAIIHMSLQKHIPIYGFCRGMQSILDYFNIPLKDVVGHVSINHGTIGEINGVSNSYHNQATFEVPETFEVIAKSEDGVVEAIRHKQEKILATMWHPERELPFRQQDIEMVKEFFN